METSETNKAARCKADGQTTINPKTIEQETVGRDLSDRRNIGQDDVDQETADLEATDGQKTADRLAELSEEEQSLKRYRHC